MKFAEDSKKTSDDLCWMECLTRRCATGRSRWTQRRWIRCWPEPGEVIISPSATIRRQVLPPGVYITVSVNRGRISRLPTVQSVRRSRLETAQSTWWQPCSRRS